MSKNIVIFSDGTGQEGGVGYNTNVYKLFNMVEDRTHEQIAFYDRGLGTENHKLRQKVTGQGISKNILDCYTFLFENYCAGDRIFLFGFSRGAATVRSLSGFIHLFGVLPKSRPELIPKAYTIYKLKNKQKRLDQAKAFINQHHTMWCTIEFLGVWDTVAALCTPFQKLNVFLNVFPVFRHQFHDLTLSESVLNARHALAIDDERKTFHPTVWEKKHNSQQTMKQVWFCGMHTDVGGGYKEAELSDISLDWMINEAVPYGLRLYRRHKTNPAPNGIMHNSRENLGKCYRQQQRSWDSDKLGKPLVHETVFIRTLNQENKTSPAYDPWILKIKHDMEPWHKPEDQ